MIVAWEIIVPTGGSSFGSTGLISTPIMILFDEFNDLGEAIGKWKDYSAAKFDVRITAGSTLPVNRWAYLDELKQMLVLL